ncbi:leucine-rich_repeat domain-containing protein [Hexamita inflata]|uniref:Leucine-rich repeat domain-containing protein n=1 Tax=Hexamita inflata TaxID=28002 RepID=A0AA86NSZ4_9EUKA|nr:leucine-rich repeat domain-containing protein [Hexamita inflata]
MDSSQNLESSEDVHEDIIRYYMEKYPFLIDHSSSEHITEQYLIDELRNQIVDNKLTIEENDELKNTEFLNDFEIEELNINECQNIVLKLNHNTIKKLQLDHCRIQCSDDFQLPNLKVLSLTNDQYENKATFFQSIGKFKNLKEVMLCDFFDVDLNMIPQQITDLQLLSCDLTNIELLTQFTYLTNLDLAGNGKIDIRPLSTMRQLTVLGLCQCGLKNVDSLKSLVQLKDLNISCNYSYNNDQQIQSLDIHSLQYLKQLTQLNLTYCYLVDVSCLKPLSNLKSLDIAQNNIVYLEPLKDLKQLEFLNIWKNCIQDTSVLNNHPNFNFYNMDDQKQPDKQLIAEANKLRDINVQISQLRNITKLDSSLKSKMTWQSQKVCQFLYQIHNAHNQFSESVASLFQLVNTSEGLQ